MKILVLLFCCLLAAHASNAQKENLTSGNLKPATFGFGTSMVDFTTAQRIRRQTLASTLNNKRLAKFSELGPGITLSYMKGLRPKLDFATSLGFGSGTVYLENNPDQSRSAGFVSADAGIHLKLLTEEYAVNPFVSTGLGLTITKGFYGAMIPFGLGVRFRLSDEAAMMLQSQYRAAITETAGYHFVHGLTVTGKL